MVSKLPRILTASKCGAVNNRMETGRITAGTGSFIFTELVTKVPGADKGD